MSSAPGGSQPPSSNKNDPLNGIQIASKGKRRPYSAMESRDLISPKEPTDKLRNPPEKMEASASQPKITFGDGTPVPFVTVLPSNPVKKAVKPSAKDANSANQTTGKGTKVLPGSKPSPRITAPSMPLTPKTPRSAKLPLLACHKTTIIKQSPRDVSSANKSETKGKSQPSSARDFKSQRPRTAEASLNPHHQNVSAYRRTTAQSVSVNNAKNRGKSANKQPVKTQVVLAPRFGPDSEQSTLEIDPHKQKQKNCFKLIPSLGSEPQKAPTKDDTDGSVNFSVEQMVDFSPAKTEWVKRALEKLGKAWVASGVVPKYMMDFPEFQKKIGDLYDIAVDKKCNQLKSATVADSVSSASNSESKSKLKHKVGNIDLGSDLIPEEVQKQISDIVLHLLMAKLMPSKEDPTDGTNVKGPSSIGGDSSTVCSQDSEVRREIVSCYVLKGKIRPLNELPKKTKHSFASLGESRRRTDPEGSGEYFRRIADLKGFEADEVTLRYTKTRIFVEGRQPHKGEKNARQVREIIALPKTLGVQDLKVMRGRKGLLVFEEVPKSLM